MSQRVLLVDPDKRITAFLAEQLVPDDYTPVVCAAADVGDVTETIEAVVLGDLPDRRATLAILDALRSGDFPLAPDTPAIVLTRFQSAVDVIRAFEHGADDVIAKPFEYVLLRTRLDALLRRHLRKRGHARVMRVADLMIDTHARTVRLGGCEIAVTGREFSLLCHLATEPERVFTKAELIDAVWHLPPACRTRTVDSHVCRLRQKLAVNGDQSWLRNEWGIGYALVAASRNGDHRLARLVRPASAARTGHNPAASGPQRRRSPGATP